jgi:hypothetical protein
MVSITEVYGFTVVIPGSQTRDVRITVVPGQGAQIKVGCQDHSLDWWESESGDALLHDHAGEDVGRLERCFAWRDAVCRFARLAVAGRRPARLIVDAAPSLTAAEQRRLREAERRQQEEALAAQERRDNATCSICLQRGHEAIDCPDDDVCSFYCYDCGSSSCSGWCDDE